MEARIARELVASGAKQSEVARLYGVSPSVISNVVNYQLAYRWDKEEW